MDRILKKGRALEGDEFKVEARECDTPLAEGVPSGLDTELTAEGGHGTESGVPGVSDHKLAKDEADRIMAEAKELASEATSQATGEAEALLSQAKAEAERYKEQAYSEIEEQRARLASEVRAEIEAEYREKYQHALLALDGAARDLKAERVAYLKEIELPAYGLVLALARQLLGKEPTRDPEFMAALIGQALALLNPQEAVAIRVSPAVFHVLIEDNLLSRVRGDISISQDLIDIEIDELLNAGQFKVTMGGALVQYDLEVKLDELITHLEQRGTAHRPDDASASAEDGA